MSQINYVVFEMKLLNRAVDDSNDSIDDDNVEIKIESFFIPEECRSPMEQEKNNREREAKQRYENHPR